MGTGYCAGGGQATIEDGRDNVHRRGQDTSRRRTGYWQEEGRTPCRRRAGHHAGGGQDTGRRRARYCIERRAGYFTGGSRDLMREEGMTQFWRKLYCLVAQGIV
jgi:hypothetical protein